MSRYRSASLWSVSGGGTSGGMGHWCEKLETSGLWKEHVSSNTVFESWMAVTRTVVYDRLGLSLETWYATGPAVVLERKWHWACSVAGVTNEAFYLDSHYMPKLLSTVSESFVSRRDTVRTWRLSVESTHLEAEHMACAIN